MVRCDTDHITFVLLSQNREDMASEILPYRYHYGMHDRAKCTIFYFKIQHLSVMPKK